MREYVLFRWKRESFWSSLFSGSRWVGSLIHNVFKGGGVMLTKGACHTSFLSWDSLTKNK